MIKALGAISMGLCAWLALTPAFAAQPSEAQVRELMVLMKVPDQFAAMNQQMVSMMQQQLPCVPSSYWQGYIDKDGQAQLLKAMVPAYQHHFSAEDVEGLIRFYKSSLGQKLVAQMQATMAEASQAGQAWSRQRTQSLFDSLQKDGKLDAQGHCPATGSAAAAASSGAVTESASPADSSQSSSGSSSSKAGSGKAKHGS